MTEKLAGAQGALSGASGFRLQTSKWERPAGSLLLRVTDFQSLSFLALPAYVLGKSVCAHPLELEELGASLLAPLVGSGHQKLLFYQHCTEGKGNSSKGSQSPIRKATRKDIFTTF